MVYQMSDADHFKYHRLRDELRTMCETHTLFLRTSQVENLLIEVHNADTQA